MSPVRVSRRSIAALLCLALAATPAAAQVKADGTPIETTPKPTVKRDNSGAAAAAAGALAIGTAIWLHHRAEEKKKAEAAAAAAATPPEPTPVETVATAPAPTPAQPAAVPPPPAVDPTPTPVPAKKPVQISHHGSSTSSNHKAAPVSPAAPAVVPVVEPVAPPVVQAEPVAEPPAPPKPANDNRALWIALGVLAALLFAVRALPRMRMAPPGFRARARMSPPLVSAPAFTQSKADAA